MPLLKSTTATPEGQALIKIASIAQLQFNKLLSEWSEAINTFWGSPNPQAIATLMGTDARNNFAASAATGAYLLQFSSLSFDLASHNSNVAAINAIGAKVGTFTVNGDGTITGVTKPVAPAATAPAPAAG